MPDVLPENFEIIEVYQMVCNQHIMGPSGPVDLDLNAVIKVMELFNVKDKVRCLELVHKAYNYMLDKERS